MIQKMCKKRNQNY